MSRNKTLCAFGGAVLVQILILAAVPAPRAYTLLTGRTVILKTAPVDPYDVLSGYYVTLGYDIDNAADRLKGLGEIEEGDTVYAVLAEGADGCWVAESAYPAWPKDVPADRVVIKGEKRWRRIRYGIETYFVPEADREKVEKDLRENRREARVEVKVDVFGRAAIVRLLIGDRVYEY